MLEHHPKLSCYVRNHDCLTPPRCSGLTDLVLTVFFSSPVTFTITSALSSKFFIYFFLNTNFPSCTDHPHMTSNPVSGILSKRHLMSFTVMVVKYVLLVLFAQRVIFIPTLILNLFWFSSCPCSGPRPVLAVDNVLVFFLHVLVPAVGYALFCFCTCSSLRLGMLFSAFCTCLFILTC